MQCYMDQTVDPCDRFFDYACGRWSNYHPIPNDKGGYDTFEILREDLSSHLVEVLILILQLQYISWQCGSTRSIGQY